tara:strand:+ start:2371 stop:3015 length:645 start_codon:yes stop_codon:yes gene_type:complete
MQFRIFFASVVAIVLTACSSVSAENSAAKEAYNEFIDVSKNYQQILKLTDQDWSYISAIYNESISFREDIGLIFNESEREMIFSDITEMYIDQKNMMFGQNITVDYEDLSLTVFLDISSSLLLTQNEFDYIKNYSFDIVDLSHTIDYDLFEIDKDGLYQQSVRYLSYQKYFNNLDEKQDYDEDLYSQISVFYTFSSMYPESKISKQKKLKKVKD